MSGSWGQMMEPYYADEYATIYHGDCRDVRVSADVLVSDPPYPNNAGHFDEGIHAAREFLAGWRGREAIVFWSELEQPPVSLPIVAVHVWHRTNVNGRPYEPAFHFHLDGEKRRSDVIQAAAVFDGVGPGCWEYAGHPTQKNLSATQSLVARLRESSSPVLDPFAGVGTTLVAAKNLGRKAIGIEIEERYCEIAAERLSQGVLALDGA